MHIYIYISIVRDLLFLHMLRNSMYACMRIRVCACVCVCVCATYPC